MLNEEVHNVLHAGVTDRLKRIEDRLDLLVRPEDGTLAKMHQSAEETVEKLEAKFNWLVIFLFTTVVGALGTILAKKFGFT